MPWRTYRGRKCRGAHAMAIMPGRTCLGAHMPGAAHAGGASGHKPGFRYHDQTLTR
jgi:hypothetical protein